MPSPAMTVAVSMPSSSASKNDSSAVGTDRLLEGLIWPDDRPPHMRYGAAVVAQSFFRLFEVAADDVGERFDGHHHVRIKRIQIVHRHHPRFHIPLVFPHPLV